VKIAFFIAVSVMSVAWADETTDRAAIETTIAALSSLPTLSNLFTADFANADELQRFLREAESAKVPVPTDGVTVKSPMGTLVISKEPMGEATLYPIPLFAVPTTHFVTRSVTFISSDTSVVVAVHEPQLAPTPSQSIPVLLVLRHEGSDWRVASFRVLTEARTKVAP
jgi:hypothetical protein